MSTLGRILASFTLAAVLRIVAGVLSWLKEAPKEAAAPPAPDTADTELWESWEREFE